jgi:hypothetical protein
MVRIFSNAIQIAPLEDCRLPPHAAFQSYAHMAEWVRHTGRLHWSICWGHASTMWGTCVGVASFPQPLPARR